MHSPDLICSQWLTVCLSWLGSSQELQLTWDTSPPGDNLMSCTHLDTASAGLALRHALWSVHSTSALDVYISMWYTIFQLYTEISRYSRLVSHDAIQLCFSHMICPSRSAKKNFLLRYTISLLWNVAYRYILHYIAANFDKDSIYCGIWQSLLFDFVLSVFYDCFIIASLLRSDV